MCSVSPIELDRVEARPGHVPVVQVPHLGQPGQALPLDRGLAPGRLLRGQRDAERLDAVLPCGVHHHAAPAAAHVEQPHTRTQPQLPRHQVELINLRLLQGRILVRVAGTGVGHGRPEHPLIEPVGHVVVVRDRVGIAALGVPPAAQPAAVHPDLLRRRRHPVHQELRPAQGLQQPQLLGHGQADGLGLRHPGQGQVHVAVDVQVPRHVGTGQPERPGSLSQVRHGHRRADRDLHRRPGRAGVTAVIRAELHRGIRPHDRLEDLR